MTYVFFYFCFFSLDCGIFTLKFMEIWRPRVLLTNQFSQKDIPNIRIQYVNKLFFHPCNIVLNSATKKLVTDYYAKVSSHLNFFLKNMFFKFFSSVTFTFSFFFLFFCRADLIQQEQFENQDYFSSTVYSRFVQIQFLRHIVTITVR